MYLPQGVLNCINALDRAGYRAYAVGGCVRDSLMGLTPKDWDITINCPPEKTKEIFDALEPLVRELRFLGISESEMKKFIEKIYKEEEV